jgi:uroporphyrinogen decarboxylase
MFKEWMVPRYKRLISILNRHGIDVVITDCDGNINELVGLWIEGGVNCMFPLEINSHTIPAELRAKYGQQVLLAGGVDKIQLAGGKKEIEQEIERLRPTVETGGFIPHVDHRVPPDVSYDNYLYYLKLKRQEFCS